MAYLHNMSKITSADCANTVGGDRSAPTVTAATVRHAAVPIAVAVASDTHVPFDVTLPSHLWQSLVLCVSRPVSVTAPLSVTVPLSVTAPLVATTPMAAHGPKARVRGRGVRLDVRGPL